MSPFITIELTRFLQSLIDASNVTLPAHKSCQKGWCLRGFVRYFTLNLGTPSGQMVPFLRPRFATKGDIEAYSGGNVTLGIDERT